MAKDPQTKKGILKAFRLNREERSRYRLKIKANDNGNPQLSSETSIVVDIDDINDNSPVFKQARYQTSIKETVGINTYVLKVRIHLQKLIKKERGLSVFVNTVLTFN